MVEPLVSVQNLSKRFPLRRDRLMGRRRGFFTAVDRVNMEIWKGETFGVVGESGSGKTTLARLILRLERPSQGRVFLNGRNITAMNRREIKKIRREMQMIFQDPYSSLDPRKNILNIVAEPLKVHQMCAKSEMRERVAEALRLVELPSNDEFMEKMPEELSGGQRQRVGIARVLVLGAKFIIGDEPVSMLDANVKAGIVALMQDLKQKADLTYLFITHEIGLAYHICDRIAVMYRGRIVELGPSEEIIRHPRHPYTRVLMEAIPPLEPREDWGNTIQGRADLTNGGEPDTACLFVPRCPHAVERCRKEEPQIDMIGKNHYLACHNRLQ